jgi:hypothetical protein
MKAAKAKTINAAKKMLADKEQLRKMIRAGQPFNKKQLKKAGIELESANLLTK